MTKSLLADSGSLVIFLIEACCVSDKKLCPVWPFHGPSSWLIDLDAASGLRSLPWKVHYCILLWLRMLGGPCQMTRYCAAAVCLSVNLSVFWSFKACLLFGCHGWKAWVFQVNVLSATFVPVLAHNSVCTVQNMHIACLHVSLFSTKYVRGVDCILLYSTSNTYSFISRFREV